MGKLRKILFPFSILYDGITSLKNYLYNSGVLSSTSFDLPLIIIGNLSVGGTGKTPHTEYIAQLIKDQFSTAILSRGYGRKTTGYIDANRNSSAKDIGDEPLELFTKIRGVSVSVCENRVVGATKIIEQFNPEVILLDDAFQHRKIVGSLNIILTPFDEPFFKDLVLPAGNLRENTSNAARADIIIITKCPDNLSLKEKNEFLNRLKLEPNQQAFFTSIQYKNPIGINTSSDLKDGSTIALISGIVNPRPLQKHLENRGNPVVLFEFPDHYDYSKNDLEQVQKKIGKNTVVATTSKDAVKIEPLLYPSFPSTFEVPIGIQFLFNDQNRFNKLIISHIESFSQNN